MNVVRKSLFLSMFFLFWINLRQNSIATLSIIMEETIHLANEDLNCKIQSLKVREKLLWETLLNQTFKVWPESYKYEDFFLYRFPALILIVNTELTPHFQQISRWKIIKKNIYDFQKIKTEDPFFFFFLFFFCTRNVFLQSTVFTKGILMQIWKSANIFVFIWK